MMKCFYFYGLLILVLAACNNPTTAEKNKNMTPDDYAAIPCIRLDHAIYPPLDEEADAWFREAYELETPRGMPIDFKKVAALYQKAVDKGHYKAMNNLSILYLRGLGVEQSEQKSVELDLMMAALNVPEGHMAVGLSTDEGRGGLQGGREKALEYYATAARQGHPKAQIIIGRQLLYNWNKKTKGLELLQCSLSQKYPDAAWELGAYHSNKDYPKTVYYYREGAKLGQKYCVNQLMNAYEDGRFGLNEDHDRALCFLSIKRQLDKNPSLKFPNLDELCPGTVEQPY